MKKFLDNGEFILFATLLIWCFFPIVNKLSFNTVPPVHAAGYASLIAGVTFLVVLALRGQLYFFKTCTVWKEISLSTLFIGILFYGLVFYGTSLTTAGNASVFTLFEVFFTYLILSVLTKNEAFVKEHIAGACLMVAGALIILVPKMEGQIAWGEIFIMTGCMFTPLGNKYAKAAIAYVSPFFLMTVRSLISGVFLLGLAFLIETPPAAGGFVEGLPYLIINGVLLLGFSKILWLESIRRITITKAQSISVITPVLTLFFAWLILGEKPTFFQITGLLPVAAGAFLLLRK